MRKQPRHRRGRALDRAAARRRPAGAELPQARDAPTWDSIPATSPLPGSRFRPAIPRPPAERAAVLPRRARSHAAVPGVVVGGASRRRASVFGGCRSMYPDPRASAEAQAAPGIVQFCSDRYVTTIGLRAHHRPRPMTCGRRRGVAQGRRRQRDARRALSSARRIPSAAPCGSRAWPSAGHRHRADLRDHRRRRDVANLASGTASPQVYVSSDAPGPSALMLIMRTTVTHCTCSNHAARDSGRRSAGGARRPLGDARGAAARVYAQPRFSLIVLLMFAARALALVALGVYGVMAYTVRSKRGHRHSHGARRRTASRPGWFFERICSSSAPASASASRRASHDPPLISQL